MGLVSRRPGTLAIAAVSDGHGSARHFRSRVGSSHAVNLAAGLLEEFLIGLSDPTAPSGNEQLQELQKKLVASWRASVEADYQGNPFTAEEMAALMESEGEESCRVVEADPAIAYGATLLAAGTLGNSILYLQLGDGDILTVAPGGVTSRPLPEDERLIANQTTSLCMPEAWKDFRAVWSAPAQTPALVLLSTDGYINSFRSERDFLQIGADYLQLLRQQGIDAVAHDLPNILSQASQEGSGDDISVAFLLSEPVIGEEAKKQAPAVAPMSAKSEMIVELTEQHAQQQKALSELTQRVEQAHRENHRLRRRLLWATLVVLAATAFLTRHYWMAYLPHGAPDKPHASRRGGPEPVRDGHGDLLPSDLPASSPADDTWLLRITEQSVPLPKGAQILGGQILGVPAKAGDLYAEVAQDKSQLELINRSRDTWAATTASGKKSSVKTGEFVVLAAGTRIVFKPGKSGVLEKVSPAAAAQGGSNH
jgi:Protein phosphatase 2C